MLNEECEECGEEGVVVSETPDGDWALIYCPACGDKRAERV